MDLGSKAPVEPWMLAIGGIRDRRRACDLGVSGDGNHRQENYGAHTESRVLSGTRSRHDDRGRLTDGDSYFDNPHTRRCCVGCWACSRYGALDLSVVGRIILSWVATLPLAAGLSIFFFYFFKGLLAL